MAAQQIVLGELTDFLTGQTLVDTEDERLRQQIARRLVTVCRFDREQIRSHLCVPVCAGEKNASVPVDFVVSLAGAPAMMIKYGPGSIVTRHRPALALARLLGPNMVSVVVVTNGREADVLESSRGRIIGSGLEALLCRADLEQRLIRFPPVPVDARQAEMAARIVYAFEIDGSCAWDLSLCRNHQSQAP
jgi:hypothetical protein